MDVGGGVVEREGRVDEMRELWKERMRGGGEETGQKVGVSWTGYMQDGGGVLLGERDDNTDETDETVGEGEGTRMSKYYALGHVAPAAPTHIAPT